MKPWLLIMIMAGCWGQANQQPAPQRIITLAPHLNEMVGVLGRLDDVVGTVAYSDHSMPARQIPLIGRVGALSLEAMVRLRPDIILAWEGSVSPMQAQKLQAAGLRLWWSRGQSMADIQNELLVLGDVLDRAPAAQAWLARGRTTMARPWPARPMKVMVQIADQPLMAVRGDTFIGETVRLCGVTSITEQAISPYPVVSKELIVRHQPDKIIVFEDAWQAAWHSLTWKPQVLVVPAAWRDRLLRPSPLLWEIIPSFCHWLRA